jgi:hypothetical protein
MGRRRDTNYSPQKIVLYRTQKGNEENVYPVPNPKKQ